MSFTYCVVTSILLLSVSAGVPICETVKSQNENPNLPSHEPLLPNVKNMTFFNCSLVICESVKLNSFTQITVPEQRLRVCYPRDDDYICHKLKYHSYKNIDKLLFLSNNIPDKEFYLIDCLVYSEGGRVCHKKDEHSHAKLIDTGNIVRPQQANVLSQDEFLCEESDERVLCDLNPFVPYDGVLKVKDVKIVGRVILKTGTSMVSLEYGCLGSWCGYASVTPSRRMERYDPPGGKVYRCYYANRQQVCKELYGSMRPVYNDRDWLSS